MSFFSLLQIFFFHSLDVRWSPRPNPSSTFSILFFFFHTTHNIIFQTKAKPTFGWINFKLSLSILDDGSWRRERAWSFFYKKKFETNTYKFSSNFHWKHQFIKNYRSNFFQNKWRFYIYLSSVRPSEPYVFAIFKPPIL
jgi:hypothetical protein